jgi:hypothetical protein
VIGAIMPSETVPEQPAVPPPALPVDAGVVGVAAVSVLPPPPPQPAATTASASAALAAAAARTALIAIRLPLRAGLKRPVTLRARAVM